MALTSNCPVNPDAVAIGDPRRRGRKVCNECHGDLHATGNGWAHTPRASQTFYLEDRVVPGMQALLELMAGGRR